MKKIYSIPFIMMCGIYLLLMTALLSIGGKYMKDTPAYSRGVRTIRECTATVENQDETVMLPHRFSGFPARTAVTLTTTAIVDKNDCLYIKSVYAPLKVYANEILVYQCGQDGSYPSFMKDPATTVATIPLDGVVGKVTLRLEYLFPASRGNLLIQPPLLGREAAIFRYLLPTMGFAFVFSLVQMFIGLLMTVISLFIMIFERKGQAFCWLGLFSFVTGMWAFGECNLTGLFISSPTLLYLMAFIGLFTLPIPLLLFGLVMVNFHNPVPVQLLVLTDGISAVAALALQLFGMVSFSKSMYFFHFLVPFSLFLFTAYVLHEGIRYHNQTAWRFLMPIAVLFMSAVLELANYSLRFTNILSLFFQSGVLFFTLMMGVIGGLFIRDSLVLKQQKQKLQFEMNLMEYRMTEQKRYTALMLKNADDIKKQRHDLRHQITVLQKLCEDEKFQKLKDYLDTLAGQLPSGQEPIYCKNEAVNAIISHYAALARAKDIELTTRLIVPEQTKQISDTNLCVIFGNLFENAIEACCRMNEGPFFIHLNSYMHFDTLVITMDNSFDGKVIRQGGRFFSRKRNDFGTGTASVITAAQQHDGGADFTSDGHVFKASVYLQI